MKKPKYKIDKRFEKQALEEIVGLGISINKDVSLQGVAKIDDTTLRIHYKIGDSYDCFLTTINKELSKDIKKENEPVKENTVLNNPYIAVKLEP